MRCDKLISLRFCPAGQGAVNPQWNLIFGAATTLLLRLAGIRWRSRFRISAPKNIGAFKTETSIEN
jgi:hypothetical protein